MNYKELADLIFPDAKDISYYEEKYKKRELPEGAMVLRVAPSPTGNVHIGTIYQACNFDYVGAMRKGKERTGCIINGKLYGSRSLRAKFGHSRQKEILEQFPDAKFIKQKSKDRYFYFRGDKKTRKRNRKAIEHLIKPYPKRTATAPNSQISNAEVEWVVFEKRWKVKSEQLDGQYVFADVINR